MFVDGSPFNTTRSACLPTAIVPTRASTLMKPRTLSLNCGCAAGSAATTAASASVRHGCFNMVVYQV
jgi:hypothetical protein